MVKRAPETLTRLSLASNECDYLTDVERIEICRNIFSAVLVEAKSKNVQYHEEENEEILLKVREIEEKEVERMLERRK
ncbi:hypothetical protein [Elioraea sp.]|uniref:hypothetical protein n=1 Tax=Elioraea sp. TaxID=2185103 RepID=UPI003F7166DA